MENNSWELESENIDEPSLETTFKNFEDNQHSFGDKTMFREKTTSDFLVNIRSMPKEVWETIRFITLRPPSRHFELKSITQGCLIHCGLLVVEHILRDSHKTQARWLDAYEKDDTDILSEYLFGRMNFVHMGKGIGQTRRVYFLNSQDQARAMEIASQFNFSLSEVAVMCMVAGISMSETMLPRHIVRKAKKEVETFKKHYIKA